MAAEDNGRSRPRPRSTAAPLPRAWLSVALLPVFLLVFVVVMLLLYEAFGYKPENADAPFSVALVIGLLSLAVFLVPCASAVLYGRRASRAGDRRGLWPASIGALAGVAVAVLTVVDAFANSSM